MLDRVSKYSNRVDRESTRTQIDLLYIFYNLAIRFTSSSRCVFLELI